MTETKVKFSSYDGYALEGKLVKSTNEKAAVLFIHGITSSQDELGFHSDYAKFLGENEITSLRFDYRYHGVRESSLENLSLCGVVNDIDAAFACLKTNASKSTSSFFIVGTSFGGGLSIYWADTTNPSGVKKIFLNAPVIDYEDDVLGRNNLLVEGSLTPRAQKQLKQKGFVKSSDIKFGRALINELKYINGIKGLKNLGDRVVIFHGDEDEDVPLASSKKYKSEKTILNIVPGVGHGFGVEDDEDLDFPETKAIHRKIYEDAFNIIQKHL